MLEVGGGERKNYNIEAHDIACGFKAWCSECVKLVVLIDQVEIPQSEEGRPPYIDNSVSTYCGKSPF